MSGLPVRPRSPALVAPPPFPFLSLPAELRLQIYEELLLDASSFVVPTANQAPTRCNASKALHPAILGVCRAVHAEALPVLYGGTTFWIRTFPARFCRRELVAYFGVDKASLIRRVFAFLYEGDGGSLTRELVRSMYGELGIDLEQLHVWAVRTMHKGTWQRAAEEQADWLVEPEGRDRLSLGIVPEWFDFGDSGEEYWLVKRGSMPRGQGGWKIGV